MTVDFLREENVLLKTAFIVIFSSLHKKPMEVYYVQFHGALHCMASKLLVKSHGYFLLNPYPAATEID